MKREEGNKGTRREKQRLILLTNTTPTNTLSSPNKRFRGQFYPHASPLDSYKLVGAPRLRPRKSPGEIHTPSPEGRRKTHRRRDRQDEIASYLP